jgi:DNA-binding MarR family transcriptional regulator
MSLRDNVSPTMPIQQVDLLCYLSVNPGSAQQDISAGMSMTQGATSRNLRALGSYMEILPSGKERPGGLGLVEVRIDAYDPRRRNYSLTRKGELVIEALNRVLNGG